MENISLCIILVVETKIKHFTVRYSGRKHFIVHYSGRNKDRRYMINGPPLRAINHQFLFLLLAVASVEVHRKVRWVIEFPSFVLMAQRLDQTSMSVLKCMHL